MAEIDELRLLLKIANFYFKDNLKQQEIAKILGISQSYVSRSINKAQSDGLVKVSIKQPPGIYLNLENQIQKKYGLNQAIIVDVPEGIDDNYTKTIVGTSAAHYLETILRKNDVLGISSWSSTITAMVENMHFSKIQAKKIIQLLGGVGNNGAFQATYLTQKLADLLNAKAYMLPAQSIEASPQAKEKILENPEVKSVFDSFSELDVAIVGIGNVEPSEFLRNSGNYFNKEALRALVDKGAVGDICLHYFDEQGKEVLSIEDDPVIAISLEQIKQIGRAHV